MENLEQKTKVSMGKGRPPKHGGYSLMVRAGEIPERMTHIRRYLTDVWDGLIRDVAGTGGRSDNGPTLTDGAPRKAGLELANALQKKLGPLDILVNDLNKTRTRVEARRFSPLDCPVNARQGDDQGHRR